MAYLGNIFIAGSEEQGGNFKSGIAFYLSKMSSLSYIHEVGDGSWQVEFSINSDVVVARTTEMLTIEDLQLQGFNEIQFALDILAIKSIFSTTLNAPANSNIGVYYSNGKSIAYTYSLDDFAMQFNVKTGVVVDASGKEVKQPEPEEPKWNESFRYYRLSQCSTDLFEAYRNLFLAFEALLNEICPKEVMTNGTYEGEEKWLKRSLKVIESKVKLSIYTPSGKENPAKYIINSQYKNIRCKIQHAKFPYAVLPHAVLSPIEVYDAYDELIRIWRHIANVYYDVPIGGSVTTHGGFKHMLSKALQNISVQYTNDSSEYRQDDTKVSPRGEPVYKFVSSEFKGQTAPGIVRVSAYEDTLSLKMQYEKPIFRICIKLFNENTKTKSAVAFIRCIRQGLVVSGVDGFEYIQDLRNLNPDQPNTTFKT